MKNRKTYTWKAGLKTLGFLLLLGCMTSCAGYKVLNIDVLKPGGLDLGSDEVQMIFLDRKIIHQSDSISAPNLYHMLRLRRDDLVNCFYDGLRDGLRNGVRPVLLIKGLGLNPKYVPDGYEPEPITPEGINALKKNARMTHVLAVEYCKFNLDQGTRILLDNNILVRLYDANGQVIDSMNSQKMGLYRESVEGEDDYTIICNFFYDKGWKYAERLTPTWTPQERRVYTGNRILDVGYHFFVNENPVEARRVWEAALELKPTVAAKAAVNLAWLYEQESNFTAAKNLLEAALLTLQKADINNHLSEYIKEYITTLDKRIQDETTIMEQL